MASQSSNAAKRKIRCRCGARLALPATAAGKVVRCPKCETKHRVPTAGSSATKQQSKSAAKRTAEEPIVVYCDCGAKLKAPANAAGKQARCPKCRASVTLVVPASAKAAPKPATVHATSDAGDGLYDFAFDENIESGAAVETPKPQSIEEYDERPPVECPACEQSLPADSKICVACGIDLKTGRGILMVDDDHIDAAYTRTEATIRVISWLIPLSFVPIPIGSEAFGTHKPWVVRGIALVTTLVSVWFFGVTCNDPSAYQHLMQWDGERSMDVADVLELSGMSETEVTATDRAEIRSIISTMPRGEFRWYQPFTAALLHGDIFHLLGNLIFLFAFGAGVNKALGPWWTIGLYLFFALAAGLSEHTARAGDFLHPSLGASGAIYGMAGLYVVLFPISKVHMVAWFRWGLLAGFHLSMKIWAMRGFWFLFFMIAWDAFDTFRGVQDGVAHWAHLGGFMTGFATGLVLLLTRLVNGRGTDIISVVLGRHAWKLLGKPKQIAAA